MPSAETTVLIPSHWKHKISQHHLVGETARQHVASIPHPFSFPSQTGTEPALRGMRCTSCWELLLLLLEENREEFVDAKLYFN